MVENAAIRIGVIDDISQERDGRYRMAIEAGIADVAESRGFDRAIELDYRFVRGLPWGTVHDVREAYRALAAEGVVAVLGPTITDNCVALRGLVDETRVPCLTWPGSQQARSEWMFQYQAGSLEDEPQIIAAYLAATGAHRVAVVHDLAPTGRAMAHFFEDAANRHGVTQAARIGVPASGVGFREAVLDEIAGVKPDAIVHLGMAAKPLGEALLEHRWDVPVVCNIIASMARNQPELLPLFEGWVYIDMESDSNTTLARLRARLGPAAPQGPRLVSGLDVGRLLAEALDRADLLAPEGVKEGFEAIKVVPSAAGRPGTVMGFGRYDRAALKGSYLVLRRYVNGRSVEVDVGREV